MTEVFFEHAPGHRVAAQPGPGGLWSMTCRREDCLWWETIGPGYPPTKTYMVERPKDGAA